ncbi:MAG TPA: universal stress protein [Acidimicrobiales bacterium]|jgi:nucleotide-binding universal stress UspA family protein|nr:universal stress protein [Acidimicrobiales bacterium]
MSERILVALDGTDADTRVATFVNRLFADRDDVEVVALHVTADIAAMPVTPLMAGATWWTYPAPTSLGDPAYVLTNDSNRLGDVAGSPDDEERAEAIVARSGLDADAVEVEVGDVVEAIESAAREIDATLVVVGSHRRGWFDRLVSGGSVSRELASTADRPLLIV